MLWRDGKRLTFVVAHFGFKQKNANDTKLGHRQMSQQFTKGCLSFKKNRELFSTLVYLKTLSILSNF